MSYHRVIVCALLGMTVGFANTVDLGLYSGCAASDSEFKATVLYKGPVPPAPQEARSNAVMKVAFAKQADGTADAYFIQKMGEVRRYNGKDGTVDSLGRINADSKALEHGLLGIAARRDFPRNPWLYFFYSFTESDPQATFGFRISRVRLASDNSRLDMATEQVLLRIKAAPGWNTGGAMQFDAYDDLWIAVGDNQITDEGAGNTADLRGGILRIHPDESGQGYSIPAGNFAEHFRSFYSAQGNSDLAAKYSDTGTVKPELYVKGTDNPYSLTLDPVRRWATWGDVGPDQGKVSEEYNLVKEPVFAGWPYYAGQEDMTSIAVYPGAGAIKTGSTKAAPLNGLGLGIKTLPPVADPVFARNQSCAMTGPILRYDGSVATAGQWPPQLDRKWLISGCDDYGWHLLTLDSAGQQVLENKKVFASIKPVTLIDLQQGPDGRIYYVDYGKGTLNRLEYTGSCADPGKLPEKTGCADPTAGNYDPLLPKSFHDPRLCAGSTGVRHSARASWVHFDGRSLSVSASGPHHADFFDFRGRIVASLSAAGPATHALPALPGVGVYRLRLRSGAGEWDAPLPFLGP